MGAHIKVADEVWIACALLHYENPSSSDFSIAEIEKRAVKENIYGSLRPGIRWHINLHCVANKAPNPSKHRMLFETRKGFRRLYCTGDEFHPDRSNGKKMPEENEIPLIYHYLLDWYIKWSGTKLGSGSPIMPEAAIEKENYQSEIPETKSQTVNSATDFEKVAHKVMSNYFNTTFSPQKVKNVPKEFDFVSSDRKVIGDAKYYKLVRGNSLPPAKFSTIAEHVWLLEKTGAKTTFLVFGNDRRVPAYWLERYGHLTSNTQFFFIDTKGELERLK